jgi:hypothetical protein
MIAWLRSSSRTAWTYIQAVFGLLGVISLIAWLIDVASSKHHRPLTYWLVAGLALLLVAALVWGARRGRPEGNMVNIYNMEGGRTIINQRFGGEVPPGAPEGPAPAITETGKDSDDR